MRGQALARQWRILRTIESRSYGVTVAELAAEKGCHPRTVWRDLAAIDQGAMRRLDPFSCAGGVFLQVRHGIGTFDVLYHR